MKRNYHTTEQKSTKTKDLNHKQTQNTECNTKRTSRAKKTPNTRQKAQDCESQSISEVALKQLSASAAAYFFMEDMSSYTEQVRKSRTELV